MSTSTSSKAPARPAEPPQFHSPEISSGNRVTFRIFHPHAHQVELRGEWNGRQPAPLSRDEQGLWSTTTEPLEPGIYEYSLRVDEIPTLDLKNPNLKGQSNLLLVPAAKPAFYETQAGPKGTLHVHHYDSQASHTTRRAHVYTPPGYESSKSSFPVLYLLHGMGDDDAGWSSFFGRANVILDNLINTGEAAPMIVVMPHGHISHNERDLHGAEASQVLEADLLGDLMPLVEQSYRLKKGRDNRAMAGLSMGGGQTVVIGLKHPELFSAYGVFSAGIWAQNPEPFQDSIATFKRSRARNDLLWIGCGTNDFVFDRCQVLLAELRKKNIRFTYHEDSTDHSWPTWRDYLHRLAPLLFKARS